MNNNEELTVENLDHLGLIAGIIDELEIVRIINETIPGEIGEKISAGLVVKALLLNGLGFFSSPLYLFPRFWHGKSTKHLLGEGIEADWLNDDKIGRVMDKLYLKGLSSIFLSLALFACNKYNIDTKDKHLDSTSFHLHGKYLSESITVEITGKEPKPIPLKISQGYSRDHRPDLKQFIIDLICTSDGDIHLFVKIADGNESDKAVFGEIITKFQKEVNLSGIMVADSALYSQNNLKMLENISWISRVPLTLKSAENLVKQLPESSLVESRIKGYTLAETTSNYGGIAQRWLVVSSQSRRESDLKKLAKKIEKEFQLAEKEIRKISQEQIEKKSLIIELVKRLEQKLKYHQLSELTIGSVKKKTSISVKVTQKETAITAAKKQGGRFILATNVLDESELTSSDILQKYKGQQSAERGFAFLKDPLFFTDSIFLKSPERIATLGMLMSLCLLVYTLGQRQIRLALNLRNMGLKNQLGRVTSRPTLRWLCQCFQAVHLVTRSGVKQVTNLTDERLLILNLFPKPCQNYYLLS